ncbi:MAG: hypothetical protein CK533_11445 [Acidobacterium sp.]|nr:type IV pilus secretin family protein [Acidobacteriota bacterium]PHY10117.1 MAG: hypothetical protein CK533_11445 [Acidobacterium sp.]
MHGRIPRLVLVAPLVAALAVTLTASGAVSRYEAGADTPALRSISSRLDGAVSTVLIEASEPVAYLTSQPDPLTVLVEVERAPGASTSAKAMADKPAVAAVPTFAPKPPAFAKAMAGEPTVNKVTREAATELRSVKATQLPTGFAVTLAGNGPLVATLVETASDLPPRVFLDFQGVSAGRVAAVTNVRAAGIERVRVATNRREPLITRVVIDLARQIPYTIETVGEEIRVLFTRAVEATTTLAVPAPPVQIAAAPQAPAAAPISPLQQSTNAQGQRTFGGDPITLDFQGADLRAVLRTFADISGLNIVIDPSIQGTVDVALRDVPWDQALDIILRANKLGYSVDGTIVRIVPMNVLAQESDDRKKLADANALAGELRIITRPLSYAKALDLLPIITKSSLSPRGDVQIDTRTNTLIIRDLADRLQAASELIVALDRPQPQVEIEARIITLNRNFAKQLGLQWNFNGRVDPSVGTSTGLAFPNTGVLTGGTGAVNPAAPTGLSLALGSINGALNLDVALRALETSGKVRIVSSPRVSTQNNIEAEITQGSQIPVQTMSNNTVTVTFIPAALILRVTPQITASNTVIMRIVVDKSSPNYSQVTPAQPTPSIDKQAASTTVLVPDGDTTVIGGIYNSLESTSEDRTPSLHRIPLLGWLFKNNTDRETQDELLIFITPKILK